MRSSFSTWFGSTCTAIALCLFFAPVVLAGDGRDPDPAEREIRLVKKKIQDLMQAAKALREAGRVEEAEEVEERAEEVERRFKQQYERAKRARQEEGRNREGDGPPQGERLERIVHGLVTGIEALHQLGGQEKAIAHLQHLVAELKKKHGEDERRAREREREREHEPARKLEEEKEHAEHRALRERLEALRLAHVALREGGKHDAAGLIALTIRAGELLLAGRQDEEARRVYERIPGPEDRAEILFQAAHLWREFGEPRKAEAVENLARYYAQRVEGHGERERALERAHEKDAEPREKRRSGGENERLAHEIEIMRLGMHALLEAEKHDGAHRLEQAIHANELMLARRKDPEAQRILREAPDAGQRAELLQVAAKLWREFGQPEKAEMVEKLVKHYGERWQAQKKARAKGKKASPKRPAAEGREELLHHLQAQMEEMREALELMQRQLHQLMR